MTTERVLTLPRMSRRLSVTQSWLRDQAELDLIPHVKAGKARLLFDPEVVEAAVAVFAGKEIDPDKATGIEKAVVRAVVVASN